VIDVQVEVPGPDPVDGPETGSLDVSAWPGLVRGAVQATLTHEGVEDAELSVTLLDDGPMRELNREHLGHDRTTDVISFALYQPGERVLGDVYVGWRQAIRQARAEGVPIEEEIARLAIHGTLHVLGHDHPDGADARSGSEMYRLQETIVTGLSFAPAPNSAPGASAGESA